MMEESLPSSSAPELPQKSPKAGRKSHQVHRRESSKWIPREPPISQRIFQPIRQRFDRENAK
jgi:hypothetical protein